jgi:predicted nicotinamide N-methyase
MSTEIDSDEQWMGLRELFTEEPIVPVGASVFKLMVDNGAELRVEQSVATFAREGGTVLPCPYNGAGIGADAARLTGALLWDSSVVLARFISKQHRLLLSPQARVVELGAGLGLCGLAAAAAGYPVILTDRREVLPHTRSSLAANMAALAVASGSSPSVQVLPLPWGDEEAAAALEPPVDCVLMADCVYELESIPLLVACLTQLCSPQTLVLCAYDVDIGRHTAYAAFKEAVAAAGFLVAPLDPQLTDVDGGTTASTLQPLLKQSVALLRLSAQAPECRLP